MLESTPLATARVQEGGAESAPVALWEAEERLAYAEAHMSILATEFLAARQAEREARDKAREVASVWGSAWRELAEARAALSRHCRT